MAGIIAWRRSLGIRRVMIALACTWAWNFMAEVTAAAKFGPSLALDSWASSVAILIAVKDGPDGDSALQKWSTYLRHQPDLQAAVWVLCLTHTARERAVNKLSNLLVFPVRKEESWATAMRNFRLMNSEANVFGLLGERVLPPPDLGSTILKVESAIAAATNPTVVLARSRSRDKDNNTRGTWLPDTFIAQLWCNRKMLTGSGLEDVTLHKMTLLDVLPILIAVHREIGDMVEVDGTSVINATYDVPAGEWSSLSRGNAAGAGSGTLYLGMLDLVLTADKETDEGQAVGEMKIDTAPWPPRYVLDTVQGDDGLVILNSVNCGYIDFATNFLRSVRRVTDSNKEVMWVAMDEVAFEFMDELSPGTAVLFSPEGSERHHAIKAGRFGDATFKSQVLIRPNILLHILNEGYTLLWTDSDMVWLNNPLPVLPDINDPEAAELLIQYDASWDNPCTCFLFMKPTENVKQLVELWTKAIIEDDSVYQDQAPFKEPLFQQLEAGMRMDVFPNKSFPSGREFFAHSYEEDYARIYFPEIMIVHNNFIKGHDRKLGRFQEYYLWDVGNETFPTCERRKRL